MQNSTKKYTTSVGKFVRTAKRPFPPFRTARINLFRKTKQNKIISYSRIYIYIAIYYIFFNNDTQTIIICRWDIVRRIVNIYTLYTHMVGEYVYNIQHSVPLFPHSRYIILV